MRKYILAFALVTLSVGCTNESNTINTLQDEGYTKIQTTGYAYWGCGHDDLYSTGFTATGPTGRHVIGVVCCGYTKGCTVRITH